MTSLDQAASANDHFGLLDKERIIAPTDYNRWLVPPAALAIHLCIGMAYGFSVFWLPLGRAIGMAQGLDMALPCPGDATTFWGQGRHHRPCPLRYGLRLDAVRSWLDSVDPMSRDPDREEIEFLVQAWKATYAKAKALGWL